MNYIDEFINKNDLNGLINNIDFNTDELLEVIEYLFNEIEELNNQIEQIKNDIDSNYRTLTIKEQVG